MCIVLDLYRFNYRFFYIEIFLLEMFAKKLMENLGDVIKDIVGFFVRQKEFNGIKLIFSYNLYEFIS